MPTNPILKFSPNFVLLYVTNPRHSCEFYSSLLGCTPVEQSDTFAMLPLGSGVMLGLWSKHTVEPAANLTGGGTELAMTLDSKVAVDRAFQAWSQRGWPIAQTPCDMDFGYTFVALDPDGHRLRVFVPTEG